MQKKQGEQGGIRPEEEVSHRFLKDFVSRRGAAYTNVITRFCQEMNNCAQVLIFPIS